MFELSDCPYRHTDGVTFSFVVNRFNFHLRFAGVQKNPAFDLDSEMLVNW